MRLHILAFATLVPALASTACRGGTTPPAVVIPVLEPSHPKPSAVSRLSLSPGVFQYHLTQTVQVQVQSLPDSLPSTTTTHALITVTVLARPDSAFSITVAIDSLDISTEGSIPAPRVTQSLLDSVVVATFTPATITTRSTLPNSLCAYNALSSLAQALLLPELPAYPEVPLTQVYTDTIMNTVCRANVPIQVITTRRIEDSGRSPLRLSLKEKAQLNGAGLLGQDSLIVTGSTSSTGVVSLHPTDRLPTAIETTSEGLITVQLGMTKTIFVQTSTLRLTQDSIPRS